MNITYVGQDRKGYVEDNLDAYRFAVPFELCGYSVRDRPLLGFSVSLYRTTRVKPLR